MLCHKGFVWSDYVDTAFWPLKSAMMVALILSISDFSSKLIIETNESNVGIGVILMQRGKPISIFRNELGSKMQVTSIYIKELHAITKVV